MAEETGVELVVRPVLPMVMRGVPVTRQKGLYIFTDTAREALDAGVTFGQFYDPVGEPVQALLLTLSMGLRSRARARRCSPVFSAVLLLKGLIPILRRD